MNDKLKSKEVEQLFEATKFSANKKKGYEKEKAIYDFLNQRLNTNIKIPIILTLAFSPFICPLLFLL